MTRKRILLIDDDIPLTELIQMNLDDTGKYEVEVENQALHALETARKFQPDLILLDHVMPGLDGGDVMALLRADPNLRRVPIIIVTALASSSDSSGGSPRSADRAEPRILGKPIRNDRLFECIEEELAAAG